MYEHTFTAPPIPTTIGFLLILAAVQGGLLFAVARAGGRRGVAGVLLGFAVVMIASAAAAESGLMARQSMPLPTMVYFAVCNGCALALALTRPGAALAGAVPAAYWLVFQGFRLPLEVVLHLWAEAGTIPTQMSWSGQNLDVVSGIVGLTFGLAWWRRPSWRGLGLVGHLVGLALLANVARIALLSVPSPFRRFEDPLLLPMHAPYLWILPFAVSAALFAHVVGLRALFAEARPVAAPSARAIQ